MIQPVLHGPDLLYDIRSALVDPGEVCVWWLGQSGYCFRTASALWYIDLYLSDSLTTKYAATDKPHIRMTAAPLQASEITDARQVFCSHGHTDHFDGQTLAPLFAASPEARLVLPAALTQRAQQLGIDSARVLPVRGDEVLEVDDLRVHVIPSAHPTLDFSEAHGHPYVGYLFEVDGLRLYHSGDTVLYDGLADRLRALRPDVLFLPINGVRLHGGQALVAPNMSAAEAIALRQQVGGGLVVPHHYDMFTFNTVDVQAFADLAREARIPYAILRPGAPWRFRRDV